MSALTFDAPAMSFSMPAELRGHFIHDAELDVLQEGGKNRSFEISLALAGVGAGLTQNLVKAVSNIVAGTPMNGWDFGAGVACVVALASAGILFQHSKDVKGRIDRLVEDIRNRPRKTFGADATVSNAE